MDEVNGFNNETDDINMKALNLQISPPSSVISEITSCTKSPMIHTGKGMRMEGQRDLQSSTFSISCKLYKLFYNIIIYKSDEKY